MRRWVLLLTLAALWAPSFLFIKIAVGGIPPITLAALRLTIATALLLGILRLRGGRFPRESGTWKNLAIMGFFGSALPFAAISYGEQFADSGMAAIFNGATPIATAILAHLMIHDERLSPGRIVGVVLGFVGILTIFLPELGAAHGSPFGTSLFLVAAVSYGISMVHARKHLRGLAPLVGPTLQLGLGALMLIPFAAVAESSVWRIPSLGSSLSLLFLAVFGTAVAYIVYYRLLEIASATFLSLVTYLLPPSGVLLGMMVLDERPGWNAVAGCLLIVVGVMLTNNVLRVPWRSREPSLEVGAGIVESAAIAPEEPV